MSAALARGRPASTPETLILSRRDVIRLMDQAAWLEAAELGFRAGAQGRAASPMPMAIEAKGGAFHAKGAILLGERTYVALKLNGNFPANPETRGLPTIQGALLLCDGKTGALLAIMDSIELTLRRTAAASALAARLLARPDSSAFFVAGCGALGRAHLEALAEVLPLTRCLAWDGQPGKAAAFAAAQCPAGPHGRGGGDDGPRRRVRPDRHLHQCERGLPRRAYGRAGRVRRGGRRRQPAQERDRAGADAARFGGGGQHRAGRGDGRSAPRHRLGRDDGGRRPCRGSGRGSRR
jgi:hypothetical protein